MDNYDSYTFNLFHLICAVEGGVPPVVIRNDDYTWSDLELSFKTRHFTRVVLSPGPGNPAVDKDVGVMNDILKNATNTPILGVCLGHQALALVHGVDVVRAHVPTHGRVSVMTHDGGGGDSGKVHANQVPLADGVSRVAEKKRPVDRHGVDRFH